MIADTTSSLASVRAGLIRARTHFRASKLAQNFSWYMAGEAAIRVSRLLVAVVLARWLVPAEFGIAAIALTTFELIRIAANNGSSAFIVRARAADYDATCIAIQRLSSVVAVALVVVQVALGYVIAAMTGRPELAAMIAVLAFAHLAVPLTEVRYARLQRANRLKPIAAATSAQVLLDGVLAALLALCGFGAWSIVLPRLLTTPVYVWMLRRASPEPLSPSPPLPLTSFWPFAGPYLGAEMLAALRLHLDKVLVGAVLGIDALGIYTFAFNAGLGITLTLTAALSASLYPHFSEAHRNGEDVHARLIRLLTRLVLPLSSVIAVQAAASLIYVPVLFGNRWAFAAPLVALMCLSALMKPLYDASCQALRARGETRRELIGASLLSVWVLAALGLGLSSDIHTAIACFSAANILGHTLFAFYAMRRDESDMDHTNRLRNGHQTDGA